VSARVPLGEKYLIALRFALINLSGIKVRDSFAMAHLRCGQLNSLSDYTTERQVAAT
jgi:hypothetical protein